MAMAKSMIADIEYIHQLVYDFRLAELQLILEAVRQNKTGSKQCLRKRILNLLTLPSPKTKALKQKIVQVFKSRLLTHPQPPQQPQPAQFVPQTVLNRFSRPARLDSPYNITCIPFRPNHVQPIDETPNSPIEFENLPFFKPVHTLLMPMHCQTNIDSANFTGLFFLTDSVRHSIVKSWNIASQEYKIQIILRLVQVGLEETVTQRLPYNITVSVNDRQCKLPTLNIPTKAGITPWRCNVPIDITQQTDLRNCLQNTLKITWSEEPHEYMAGVFVSQKLTWNDLLDELNKRPLRASDATKEYVKRSMENNNEDMDIVDTVFATLKDPLTKLRMTLPARGTDCVHMQCFDAIQFLQMNEQKQTWTCPICKKKVKFENIEVDEFFLNVLQSPNLSKECENVVLLKDGTWIERKPQDFAYSSSINKCQSSNNIEVVTIDDDDDDEDDVNNYSNIINALENDDVEESQKPKRFKRNLPNIEQSVIKSEHIAESENLMKKNIVNLAESDTVLDLSLKHNSAPSTSSCCSSDEPMIEVIDDSDASNSTPTKYEPVIILSDDPPSSSTKKRCQLEKYFHPSLSMLGTNTKDYTARASSSGSSRNYKHQENDNSRSVLCVITLD